jgi:hypothetical protein
MLSDYNPSICQACSASIGAPVTLKCEAKGEYFGKEVTFYTCAVCGFTFAPTNTHSYGSDRDFCESSRPVSKHGRAGSALRPGREYHMATMAVNILDRAGINSDSILIFGAGLSQDHLWLAKQFPNKKICVCDLSNFQELDNFVELSDATRFDVVVACEVAEHFTQIEHDFSLLLSKVTHSGLVVLSTNISDGSPLPALAYPFVEGHTAYYSGRALTCIAKRANPRLLVDFRVPQAAFAQLGPRKRYVFLYQTGPVTSGIAEYFADHVLAPSEPSLQPPIYARIRRWLFRRISSFFG